MTRPFWPVERRGTGIATPSSRRRVDGVEDGAMIQPRRAPVKLCDFTQLLALLLGRNLGGRGSVSLRSFLVGVVFLR